MKRLFLLAALGALLPGAGLADEIRVLSGGAAKAFVEPLAAALPGHAVRLEFQPMGRLVKAIDASVDLVIVTSEVHAELEKQGRLAPGSGTPIARVGVGVAVHERAPVPDISTPEALRRALLAAKSVVYIDPKIGTSGKHVAEVLERLGIAAEVNAKARLGQGGYVVEPVGRGEVELGLHQVSEILPVKGVRLVGELPPALQKYTVYVAVPVPGTQKGAAVRAFVEHLTSARAQEALLAAGYSAPRQAP